MVHATIDDRLRAFDLSLLESIYSQTSDDDKRSLLALHCACRDAFGQFAYLEIGSHLGGSLQALITDPACEAIVSIDPRPEQFADELLEEVRYPDNSTERMRQLLEGLEGADMGKLVTLETDTGRLAADEIPVRPRFCFIDGEHTNPTALRDAEFCLSVIRLPGVIVFHDNPLVGGAIGRFLTRSGGFGYLLRDNVFVVELGGDRIFRHPLVHEMTSARREWIWANRLRIAHRVTANPGPVQAVRDRAAVRTRLRRLLPANHRD